MVAQIDAVLSRVIFQCDDVDAHTYCLNLARMYLCVEGDQVFVGRCRHKIYGAGRRSRTGNLLITNQVLCQLS